MNRIRELRERKGLNMKETATLLNMPYTTYVNYEKGLREPTSEVLIIIADFFETTVDHLIGRDATVFEGVTCLNTGDRIKYRRKQLGMSADTLAEKIGVSRSTMFRYESGDIEKVPLDCLGALSSALLTTPEYLMGWSDDPTPNANFPKQGTKFNIVKIAGRDGSYTEKLLSDEDLAALSVLLDRLPDASDDL